VYNIYSRENYTNTGIWVDSTCLSSFHQHPIITNSENVMGWNSCMIWELFLSQGFNFDLTAGWKQSEKIFSSLFETLIFLLVELYFQPACGVKETTPYLYWRSVPCYPTSHFTKLSWPEYLCTAYKIEQIFFFPIKTVLNVIIFNFPLGKKFVLDCMYIS
jgi:hypothetical protein